MVEKFKLISDMHSSVLENVDQAQKRKRISYVAWKGKQEFLGLEEGRTMVKMIKPREKKHYLQIRKVRMPLSPNLCPTRD
jgi:hypothetical protein